MTLVIPQMTNLKETVRADCVVSVCSPVTPSIKARAHLLLVVGGGCQSLDGCLTLVPPLPSSEKKQIFLLTNVASLLAFKGQVARPRFLVTYLGVEFQAIGKVYLQTY